MQRSTVRRAANRMVRHGFTLLELLVVLAIIAVLISLSLVGLGETRHASRRLQCQVQLRQVGTALETMRDGEGFLPSMRAPVGPRTGSTLSDMHFEFVRRWYAAAGFVLERTERFAQTSQGWPLWNSPKPWRCPLDDGSNPFAVASMESLGYDPAWTLAAQLGTSYEYIGESPAFAPLIRGTAEERTVRRVLSQASERHPLAPLVFDAVPFHKRGKGPLLESDTNAYFPDGSASAMTPAQRKAQIDYQLEVNVTFSRR